METELQVILGLLMLSISAFSQDPNFQIYLCLG